MNTQQLFAVLVVLIAASLPSMNVEPEVAYFVLLPGMFALLLATLLWSVLDES